MHPFPPLPDAASVPDDHLRGHLWVAEYVDGGPMRFAVEDSGLVVVGDAERTYDYGEEPVQYRAAARYVREALDRDALRAAAADPTGVTFFGVATFRRGVDYDWDRVPAFLVTDVWSAEREGHLPPDGVARAADALGLETVPVVEKEVPAAHISPARYEIPASALREGPAAGVVFHDKHGAQARLLADAADATPDGLDGDAADLAERFVTGERIETTVARLDGDAGVDAVRDRLVEEVVRREWARLPAGFDADAFRKAVGERVARLRG